jgi:septum formation protein
MSVFFNQYKIKLASQSPRRQMLLKDSGFDLDIVKIDVEEDFPEHLKAEQIPLFLAEKKGNAYAEELKVNDLLVTADTVVWLKDRVLNKPLSMEEAADMLRALSGNTHTVYTGVCMRTHDKKHVFYDATNVQFNVLSEDMIAYYLEHFRPLDKAGAYGIQEFIGYVGIQSIQGCYYNVMGFPVSKFIHVLKEF